MENSKLKISNKNVLYNSRYHCPRKQYDVGTNTSTGTHFNLFQNFLLLDSRTDDLKRVKLTTNDKSAVGIYSMSATWLTNASEINDLSTDKKVSRLYCYDV